MHLLKFVPSADARDAMRTASHQATGTNPVVKDGEEDVPARQESNDKVAKEPHSTRREHADKGEFTSVTSKTCRTVGSCNRGTGCSHHGDAIPTLFINFLSVY